MIVNILFSVFGFILLDALIEYRHRGFMRFFPRNHSTDILPLRDFILVRLDRPGLPSADNELRYNPHNRIHRPRAAKKLPKVGALNFCLTLSTSHDYGFVAF